MFYPGELGWLTGVYVHEELGMPTFTGVADFTKCVLIYIVFAGDGHLARQDPSQDAVLCIASPGHPPVGG